MNDKIAETLFTDIVGFEWDEDKAESNFRKHGIDFDEAVEVFYGSPLLRRSDRGNEERWVAIGKTEDRFIAVVFTRRKDRLRIISARRVRKDEKRAYRHKALG
jgi:uncharacterized DUF497 family protein